ncbi:alpha,alpha-trehalose-phosphate synthase (UDP-forming) [Actinoplanes subglobosus]|uniref:Trehalose-6-phosphate synthase n=1 Tax=Actinoplanes subglobosus TaxID=1547892 RepID=A0ABV8IWW5_9ACTN
MPDLGSGGPLAASGLVTTLRPLAAGDHVQWVGWAGLGQAPHRLPARLTDVELDPVVARRYYDGYSNATLWPTYHDNVFEPRFEDLWWPAYVSANQEFARRTAAVAPRGATVCVNDYHLQLVPRILKDLRPDLRIVFFLHTAVPSRSIFNRLPTADEILRGIVGADVIGVQTNAGAEAMARLFYGSTAKDLDVYAAVSRIRAVPAQVDFTAISDEAQSGRTTALAHRVRDLLAPGRRIVLAIERIDPVKGVEQHLRAYRELIRDGSLDPRRTVLVQVGVPSRRQVPEYQALSDRVRQSVAEINAEAGIRTAILIDRAVAPATLIALYRAADVMAVTSLNDGMNLVAKEYVAARADGDGSLVLSRFAGAAEELGDALLVNPFSVSAIKAALLTGFDAPPAERRRRMSGLREALAGKSPRTWADRLLS